MDLLNKESIDLVVVFVTKDEQYAIPSVPLNVKGSSTVSQFEDIVKAVLAENNDEIENLENVEFDFLVNQKLLRLTIQEFIENEKISPETQLEIEYFVKCKPPKPHNSFLHDDWVSSVDTFDFYILSGCYDGTAHIWCAKTGKHIIAIPAHTTSIKAVKWSRTKNSLAQYSFVTCSYDETAMLWEWNSKSNQIEHIFTYIGHSRSVDCVDIKNDLAATGSYDHMLKIWSIVYSAGKDEEKKTKNKLRSPVITLEGHKEAISGCAWLNEYEANVPLVATASLDNTIKIWDIEIGEKKQSLTSNKPFLDISYSPRNNLLITASCDRHIRLWDPRQNEGSQIKTVFTSHDGWVSSVAWSVSNEYLFVSGSYDNSVKQWDIRSNCAPLYEMLGHKDKVLSVNWSNSKYIVSGASDNQIKIFATE